MSVDTMLELINADGHLSDGQIDMLRSVFARGPIHGPEYESAALQRGEQFLDTATEKRETPKPVLFPRRRSLAQGRR
jgi:hypothetical protein